MIKVILYDIMLKVKRNNAGVAQSVEQLIRNQQVVSSSLITSSKQKKNPTEVGSFFVDLPTAIAADRSSVTR